MVTATCKRRRKENHSPRGKDTLEGVRGGVSTEHHSIFPWDDVEKKREKGAQRIWLRTRCPGTWCKKTFLQERGRGHRGGRHRASDKKNNSKRKKKQKREQNKTIVPFDQKTSPTETKTKKKGRKISLLIKDKKREGGGSLNQGRGRIDWMNSD